MSQITTTRQLSIDELTKWLNSHNPGKHFWCKTYQDYKAHGPLNVIYTNSPGIIRHLRVPNGYTFDPNIQTIHPINGRHWEDIIIIPKKETSKNFIDKFFRWIHKALSR